MAFWPFGGQRGGGLDQGAVGQADGAGFDHSGQEVGIAQEFGGEAGLRVFVDLLGRAGLHDAAFVEDGDAVGEGQAPPLGRASRRWW